MKLQECKDAIILRFELLQASLIFTIQKETAYFLNNWASLLSTTFYTLSMLLFIHILYGNVKTIAGYTKDEMLLFFLIGQLAYYITATVSFNVMDDLITAINRGDLDLVLTKPIPSLFYLTTRQIQIVSGIRDGVPPTLAILIAIDWKSFHFDVNNILLAGVVFVCGLICMHVLQFLSVVPAFWFGESKRILKMAFAVYSSAGTRIPLEGMLPSLRILLSTVLPVLIVTTFTTSIILEKSYPYPLVFLSILMSVISFFVMTIVWKLALRHYTSASS